MTWGLALLEQGSPTLILEEERFNREKHTRKFPFCSLKAAFNDRGLDLAEVDVITTPWHMRSRSVGLQTRNSLIAFACRFLGAKVVRGASSFSPGTISLPRRGRFCELKKPAGDDLNWGLFLWTREQSPFLIAELGIGVLRSRLFKWRGDCLVTAVPLPTSLLS